MFQAIAAALIAATAFGAGVWVRDAFCDAAALQVQVQLEQDRHAQTKQDLDAAKLTATFNKLATVRIRANAAQREEKIRDLEEQLRKVPVVQRCVVTPDRYKRLRNVGAN